VTSVSRGLRLVPKRKWRVQSGTYQYSREIVTV
jgi:hypothetical protein